MSRRRTMSLAEVALYAVFSIALATSSRAAQKSLQEIGSKIESKKGLQVQMVDDALALGVHHAAINVNLLQLAALSGTHDNDALTIDGQSFEFNRRYAESLDRNIKPLSAHGVTVYLILLAYSSPNPELAREFIHPRYDAKCPGKISAFRVTDPADAARYKACITFLARRFATADGPPIHFIVGNEVNSHWFWYNMGEASMDAVAAEYEHAVRLCHEAVHSVSAESRVYLSLDHNWNSGVTPAEPLKSFGGRAFLEAFSTIAKRNGDFEWHLAFHPYPENLFEARTWNDKHATMDLNTPKITFKNIELLNTFMKRPEFAWQGEARRIILSEQGFHTPNAPDGELIQAAAYAYSYRKIQNCDGIDAFILHRHVDHLKEGGLSLGLWTCDSGSKPLKKKMIYDVFRLADTEDWQDAFKFALPIIGVKNWEEIR